MTIFELETKICQKFYSHEELFNSTPVDPEKETLVFCRNFTESQIRSMIVEKMRANPLIYYEVLLNSPIDKYQEFSDNTQFYNIVIPGDF